MTTAPPIPVPSATADPEDLADWLELTALQADDGNSSLQDLVRALRQTGTAEALVVPDDDELPESDRGSEATQAVAEAAFSELCDRAAACASREGAYPFSVHSQYLQSADGVESTTYTFLLLLGAFGPSAGPTGISAASLFEEISARAAGVYFGGPGNGVGFRAFGWPRRYKKPDFPGALDDLCAAMGEGQGARRDRPTIKKKKDGKLDVVVWRDFDDSRPGKAIGFGQCAAGAHWDEKIWELQPRDFISLWLRDRPLEDPTKLFFVPHRIDRNAWTETGFYAGIVFDRCRIASNIDGLDKEIARDCERWSRAVMKSRVRG